MPFDLIGMRLSVLWSVLQVYVKSSCGWAAGRWFWYFPAVVFGGGEAHLVLNPSAGKGRAGGLREFFSGVLEVGGDGTVHEVAAACVGTGRIMGVLPAGSGNDYVKALGVGTSLRRALEVLVRGKVRVVDTAEVNRVPFNNGLGIGFDAQVAAGVAEAPAYLGGTGR